MKIASVISRKFALSKEIGFIKMMAFEKNYPLLYKSINNSAFEQIKLKYQNCNLQYPDYSKYLDLHKYLSLNLKRYFRTKLHNTTNNSVLDLGTGTGYFPYICMHFGHNVKTIDIEGNPIFCDLISHLRIEREIYEIKKNTSLPSLNTKFDLICAFQICFNDHLCDTSWNRDEWEFFINDLLLNQLNEGGQIFLTLNAELKGEKYKKDVIDYFKSINAKINLPDIFIEKK